MTTDQNASDGDKNARVAAINGCTKSLPRNR